MDAIVAGFNFSGLVLTAIGAAVAAKAVIITDEQASQLSEPRYDRSEVLYTALKAQSRSAGKGLLCVFAGTVFQAIAVAAPLIR